MPAEIRDLVHVTGNNIEGNIIKAFEAIKRLDGLPEAFKIVGKHLQPVKETLRTMESPAKVVTSTKDIEELKGPLKRCRDKTKSLQEMFQKTKDASKDKFELFEYQRIAKALGKHRVEKLMDAMLEELEVAITHNAFQAAKKEGAAAITRARNDLAKVPQSLSDEELEDSSVSITQNGNNNHQLNNTGSGQQTNFGGGQYTSQKDQYFGHVPSK